MGLLLYLFSYCFSSWERMVAPVVGRLMSCAMIGGDHLRFPKVQGKIYRHWKLPGLFGSGTVVMCTRV